MRIAHISDLHLLSLEGAVPMRLFNKRLTGYVNLRMNRDHKHKPFAVRAIGRAIRALDVDHVVITGDLSNLALEREFELVQRFLDEDLAMRPDQVSLVPGNHDVYTRGSYRTKRFLSYFEPFLRSDLPDLAATGNVGAFPFVRLRGPVAIIGLSTAVPRPPLVASGTLGDAQLRALSRVLDHPEVRGRTPILLQHHPIHNPGSFAKTALEGLLDAGEELRILERLARGLVLHGHLHRRIHRRVMTGSGHVDAVGATSASLLDERDARMAGFNLYEIADDGAIVGLGARRMNAADQTFHDVPIPIG